MTAFIIFLCLASIIVIVLISRDVYIRWRLQLLIIAKYGAMKEVLDQITSSSTISEKEIRAIAIVPSLRIALYRALEAYGRQGLFPNDLYTEEKGAESYLVNVISTTLSYHKPFIFRIAQNNPQSACSSSCYCPSDWVLAYGKRSGKKWCR